MSSLKILLTHLREIKVVQNVQKYFIILCTIVLKCNYLQFTKVHCFYYFVQYLRKIFKKLKYLCIVFLIDQLNVRHSLFQKVMTFLKILFFYLVSNCHSIFFFLNNIFYILRFIIIYTKVLYSL